MSRADDHREPAAPTRLGALVHRAKVLVHQATRLARDLAENAVYVARPGDALRGAPLLAEHRSRLWTATDPGEWPLEDGKVENLRVAARKLDGLEYPAGATLSFWAQIGRPTRRQGFIDGRELREGCIVPAVAGGICQLSNALHEVALAAGLEVLERHPHSRVVPGSQAALGTDATVFWNYVDLRLRSDRPLRLEVRLTADELVVRLRGGAPRRRRLTVLQDSQRARVADHDCHTCGQDACFRHEVPAPERRTSRARTAFLVDERWPEFDLLVQQQRRPGDLLLLPLDGARLRRPRYAWTTAGLTSVQHPRAALLRALHSRRLADQGAARQRVLLAGDDRLAEAMARSLPPGVHHLVVAQNLLPALWRRGALGGRRFDVLLTRLPLAELHARLDRAAAAHDASPTLADFRCEPWRVAAEHAALAAAARLWTPHSELAALFENRAHRLPWTVPADHSRPVLSTSRKPQLWFPASTVGRKGSWELRAALESLAVDVKLWVAGRSLEGQAFWRDLDVTEGTAPPHRPDLVVLPAHVEHQPRALLTALARGVPVIATTACGLEGHPGVTTIPTGDIAALTAALAAAVARPRPPL